MVPSADREWRSPCPTHRCGNASSGTTEAAFPLRLARLAALHDVTAACLVPGRTAREHPHGDAVSREPCTVV